MFKLAILTILLPLIVQSTRIKVRVDLGATNSNGKDFCKNQLKVIDKNIAGPIPTTAKHVEARNLTEFSERFDAILDKSLACVKPPISLRKVLSSMKKEGALTFFIGDLLRNLIGGNAMEELIDLESPEELSKLLDICSKIVGDFCSGENGILVIGGSGPGVYVESYPSWKQLVEGDGTALGFTVDSLIYDWEKKVLYDLSPVQTAVPDVCQKNIRLPVLAEKRDEWSKNGADKEKTLQFWNLRQSGYRVHSEPADLKLLIGRLNTLKQTNSDRLGLQAAYCRFALSGLFNATTKICGTEKTHCDEMNKFDELFQKDFEGPVNKSPPSTVVFKKEMECQTTVEGARKCSVANRETSSVKDGANNKKGVSSNQSASFSNALETVATMGTAIILSFIIVNLMLI